jgi:hypothetical protein
MTKKYTSSVRFCAVCNDFKVFCYDRHIFHSSCQECGGHTLQRYAMPLIVKKFKQLMGEIKMQRSNINLMKKKIRELKEDVKQA